MPVCKADGQDCLLRRKLSYVLTSEESRHGCHFLSLRCLEQDCAPRILLVGDVMLDRYLWGDVERISPEAPIPVLRVGKQEHRLGGAGSVAAMVSALGAETILAAVVGDDAEGRIVRELLDKLEVNDRQVLALTGSLHDGQGAAAGPGAAALSPPDDARGSRGRRPHPRRARSSSCSPPWPAAWTRSTWC